MIWHSLSDNPDRSVRETEQNKTIEEIESTVVMANWSEKNYH